LDKNPIAIQDEAGVGREFICEHGASIGLPIGVGIFEDEQACGIGFLGGGQHPEAASGVEIKLDGREEGRKLSLRSKQAGGLVFGNREGELVFGALRCPDALKALSSVAAKGGRLRDFEVGGSSRQEDFKKSGCQEAVCFCGEKTAVYAQGALGSPPPFGEKSGALGACGEYQLVGFLNIIKNDATFPRNLRDRFRVEF
jgi:hypothetical protein